MLKRGMILSSVFTGLIQFSFIWFDYLTNFDRKMGLYKLFTRFKEIPTLSTLLMFCDMRI